MDSGEIALSGKEFQRIKDKVYQLAGISLSDAKQTMVTSRLSKLVKNLNLPSFDAYLDYLEYKKDPKHNQDFVNALTTNLTRFYREDHHFEHLRNYVTKLMDKSPRRAPDGRPRLRLWSAGCSTGQEPYTMAIDLITAFPELKRWDFRILATDIDTNVLKKAAEGIYPESELQGLSSERAKLLERVNAGSIRIPAALRQLVAFKPLNLMQDWPVKGPFDAIFCRNVAIYFDKPTQSKMFTRFAGLLAAEGYLYIGHSENLGNGDHGFSLMGKTIYQVKPNRNVRDVA